MARSMMSSMFTTAFNVKIIHTYDATPCCWTLAGLIQTRYKRQIFKRRITNPMWYWPKRKREFYDEYITSENKSFIKEVVKDRFLGPGESPLKQESWPRGEWDPGSQRTGLIGRKIGIYPMWTKSGKRLLTTLVQIVDNHVIRYHPPEEFRKMKYSYIALIRMDHKFDPNRVGSLVVGAESMDPQRYTAAYQGLFKEAGVMPKKKLTRFFITSNAAIQPGTPLTAAHFRVGDYVDVYGKTRDHGFQGVMKRWGFKGGPASHGCTKFHRKGGSLSSGRPRGMPRGKKMPGHMGSERRLTKGLKIWRINTKYNVLWIHGPAIPGPVNGFVYIMDTTIGKKKYKDPPPFPTYYLEDHAEPLPDELYDPELHVFSDPTITYEDENEDSN